MAEELSKQERTERLATRILEQARGQLISENHFLAVATGLLRVAFAQLAGALATDGRTLYVDAPRLVKSFSASGEVPVHDYVHVLMHCVLLHPFVGREVDAQAWDLACDMVAESLAAEICGPRKGVRGAQQQLVLKQVAKDIAGALTAERLYRQLRDGAYANARDVWGELFHVDDHAGWHQQAANDAGTGGAAGLAQSGEAQTDQHAESGAPTQAPSPFQQGVAPDAGAGTDSSRSGEGGSAYRDGLADGTGTDALARGGDGQPEQDDAPAQPRPLAPRELDEVRHAWEHAAKSMRVDLETLSRKRGERLGGLMRELEVSTHEQVDYREFLRQFAVRGEHLHVSDDEFDYVFYTYGLELYDDMPLIEPLEYRDERRIRDFAIVIDTSSSVSGHIVQQFVDTTFDVLSSEASFFEKVNIHIVQCDTRVQSDVKLTSLADLDRWRRTVKLYGFGGTDFRPAFAYIDELLAAGEFDDLSGVIYFTDGWGTYPKRVPHYPCAFVFYDEDHRPDLVPAWAIQVVLHPGEFESMSVY